MSVITKRLGQLEYLTAGGITVPHGFTTRFGGVSTGIFDSMNIAIKEGESEENVRKNLEILASGIGFDLQNLVTTRQTHSDIVRVVTKAGTEVIRTPHETDLWGWEVKALAQMITGGNTAPLTEGLETMVSVIETIESARKAAGIRFPGDKEA